jgi:hypothetical protein
MRWVTGGVDRAGDGAWVEEFRAWVWRPPFWSWRVRGLNNATLRIGSARFLVHSRFARGGWPDTKYCSPIVVIQTLRPLGGPSLLFEMDGKLASCSVRGSERARLRAALEHAGLRDRRGPLCRMGGASPCAQRDAGHSRQQGSGRDHRRSIMHGRYERHLPLTKGIGRPRRSD